MTPLYLGLDIGTQSVRAALFDDGGTCRGYGTSAIDTLYPRPSWAEQEPRQWWQAARAAVAGAMTKAGARADDIAAIGLDCTACTVVACDADGTPLRPALLWMDQRAFREAADINATGESVLRFASGVVSPEWMLPKALWLKRNEPAVYEKAARIVECTDWFMHRLTGRWNLSLNNVSVKWNYAGREGGFSEALLTRIGLADLRGKWPEEVVALGKGRGELSASAAAEFGLKAGTPVAQGGIDAYLGMIGLGAVGAGEMAMILGSSTCHLAMSATPILGSGMLGCFPDAVIEGTYTLEGGQTSTGSVLDWYRRHLAGHEQQRAEKEGRSIWEVLDEQARAVPAGCEGLVCLDTWQGNRCPLKDPQARGVWWGLSLSHTAGHLVRSIYEATACGTRHILEDLASHGYTLNRLFVGGGGVRSRLWLEITADVLGQPLHVPEDAEACALGAAMTAAVYAKRFASLEEAAKAMVKMASVIEPDARRVQVYEAYYARYRATYPALRALMHAPA